MTKKNKQQIQKDIEEELRSIQEKSNVAIHYNYDGSYNIDYINDEEPNTDPTHDFYDIYYERIYSIFTTLREFSHQQGYLAFNNDFSEFYDLLYYNYYNESG